MKIGILGTRGIPNNYGGFEQFAEYLAVGLVELGAEVWVYNSHNHPCKETSWNHVNLIQCFDPEYRMGLAGQFVYDFNCITDSRKRNFDILLQLGYTTNSIWCKLLPRTAKVVTNMDGLEWQRSKYNKLIRNFLKYAEKLAAASSNLLIADALPINDYLQKTYPVPSVYISYGADVFNLSDKNALTPFNVRPREYFLLIARLQPDNHIEEIIKGVIASGTNFPLLVIGNTMNRHGKYLTEKYTSARVQFLGSIFDKNILNQLRHFSGLYFHGHSAGGTNPSLLEAMAASATICAHDNVFNRSVLGNDALYFKNEFDIAKILDAHSQKPDYTLFTANNLAKIGQNHAWKNIIASYHNAFAGLLQK
jgi:glycosyltransferase involved in cell wall biosynthesis